MFRIATAAVFFLGVLAASQATADTIALKADAVGIATNSNNFTFGWAFHVSSEITVSQLVVVRKLAFWLEAGSIDKRSPGEDRRRTVQIVTGCGCGPQKCAMCA